MKIAPNRTRREICSFDRLRGISKQIYLSFYYISNVRYCRGGRPCPPKKIHIKLTTYGEIIEKL